MINFFYQIDISLFYFINHTIANPFFDKLFVLITEVKNWYIAYIILWFILLLKAGRTGKILAAASLLLIFVSDQISSQLLKNLFDRVRPCHVLDNVNLLVSCKKSLSFPSSHAVNNFAIAFLFSAYYKNLKWILFAAASVVALSRPYIGIHYPSDIIGGALIGIAIGYGFVFLTRKIEAYFIKKSSVN